MDDILTIILKDTYSLTQYKHRLMVMKTHLLQVFFGGGQNETLSTQDSIWVKSFPPNFYKQFNKDNVYDIFSGLENRISHLQILTIYLTFEPDEITLIQLGQAARTFFGFPALILDIKLNPNLIAGTALSWKGRLRDYSLKAKLEEKRIEIAQGFRRFLR